MNRQYRIVSNGIDYRVQWLGRTWLLRRPKWYWLLRYDDTESWIAEFSSVADARKAIATAVRDYAAKVQGYTPVQG